MPRTKQKTTDFYDNSPVSWSATRSIPFDGDTVFAALADTPSWVHWFPSISRAEWTSKAPFGVGSTRKVKSGPMWVYESFIVWEPGKAWGFTFVSTSIPFVSGGAELVTMTPDGNGTRVTYTIHVDPYPLMKPLMKLASPGVQGALGKALNGLELHLANPKGL